MEFQRCIRNTAFLADINIEALFKESYSLLHFVIFQIRMDSILKNDFLLSLEARGRSLVLPQLNIPGFVDSLWEALHFMRSIWVLYEEYMVESRWRDEIGETVVGI